MEVTVEGNKYNYQTANKVDYIDWELRGTFRIYPSENIDLIRNKQIIITLSNNELHKLSSEVKGIHFEILPDYLNNLFPESSIYSYLRNATPQEIGLIKSLLLIYRWTEYALSQDNLNTIRKSLFDEFIIDYSGKPEVQKDLYFISDRYGRSEYKPLIEKLIDINLLAKISVKHNQISIQNYFTPLLKPGVPRELFKSEQDPKGIKTYNIWKMILNDRDYKINNWFSNRW
jgi:hypothetical protein